MMPSTTAGLSLGQWGAVMSCLKSYCHAICKTRLIKYNRFLVMLHIYMFQQLFWDPEKPIMQTLVPVNSNVKPTWMMGGEETGKEAVATQQLVLYWGLYPSYTALYAGHWGPGDYQHLSVYRVQPTEDLIPTILQPSTDFSRALKSRKKKIINKPSNKIRKIKKIKWNSIRGDIHN